MGLRDEWRDLPTKDKQVLRDRLALAAARIGKPSRYAVGTPGDLALKHDSLMTVQRPHLRLIDEELRHLIDTPNAAVMIFTPPQIGKSSRVSRWFPFWWLSVRPLDRILLASYAERLAVQHGRAVRDYITAFGREYGLVVNPDESAASDWTLASGGGMRSRGIRGGLTGMAADLALIDDPVADRSAADSIVVRQATWEWYSGTFVSRMSPECRQVLTMTRWHPDDLAGRLLKREGRVEEGGKWRVISLPAIAVSPNEDRGIYEDPLGREPGEPLSHPRIPEGDSDGLHEHWKRQRAASTSRDWGALYQVSPFESEGALLDEETLLAKTAVPLMEPRRTGVGIDPSGGGRDTAGVVAGAVYPDGRMWWTHDETAVMSSAVWPVRACWLAYRVDADVIVYESNYGGDQAETLILQAWDSLQREYVRLLNEEGLLPEEIALRGDEAIPPASLCPRVEGVHSRKTKALRAEPIAQAIRMNRVWLAPGLKQLTTEWTLWEPGSTWSPGALDAAVHLATKMLPAINSGAVVQSVASRSRGESRGRSGLAGRTISR